MSLNKNLNKYSIRCSSEGKLVYCWDDKQPAVCPNNTSHLIDLNSIKVIDTIIQNSVNIIQSTGITGYNFRVESKKINIPPNSIYYEDYRWDYPIEIMTVNWVTDTSNIGDIVDGYVAPDTIIGAITENINIGDTIIHVSSSVLLYIKIGYEVNITNGVNNIFMGEVKNLDFVNNTLLCTIAASDNINSPAYVQMTIHNIMNMHLQPGTTNLATKSIAASLLTKETKARIKYTNNGDTEKTFYFYYEFLY
jgi:hypothetical protein